MSQKGKSAQMQNHYQQQFPKKPQTPQPHQQYAKPQAQQPHQQYQPQQQKTKVLVCATCMQANPIDSGYCLKCGKRLIVKPNPAHQAAAQQPLPRPEYVPQQRPVQQQPMPQPVAAPRPQPQEPEQNMPAPTKGKIITTMILGISSVALWWYPFITSIPCMILGIVAINLAKSCAGAPEKMMGMVKAGRITGIIGLILSAVYTGIVIYGFFALGSLWTLAFLS